MTELDYYKLALNVTMKMLAPFQPGDSRAVDDWFVACAAVQCDIKDAEGKIKKCLEQTLLLPDFIPEPQPIIITYGEYP